MRAGPPRRKPTYAVSSVDNALRLLQVLRDVGQVRGKDAAAELNISPSTVHRLMSMLVYRGFAVQDESRTYLPGPSIGVEPVHFNWTKPIRNIVKPHLEQLQDLLGETVYFMIRTGTSVRFILTIESTGRTSAGDRHGFVLPAQSSAAGRAILAAMKPSSVVELFRNPHSLDLDGMTQVEFDRLLLELRQVRSRGYALSVEEAEVGIVGVAMVLRNEYGIPVAAISTAGPVSRLNKLTDATTIAALRQTRDDIEKEIVGMAKGDV